MTDNSFFIELKICDEANELDNLRNVCTTLFNEAQFCDVTLSCKDGQIQAHRIVLSSASSYLYNLFTSTPWPTPCSHPVILLRGSLVADVRSVLEFIYSGSTKISRDKVQSILNIGRELECALLIKAIDLAVQNCGVAMFRKLISNAMTNTNISNGKSKSIDIGQNWTLSPGIKDEPLDLHDQRRSPKLANYPLTILQNAIVKKSDKKNEKIVKNGSSKVNLTHSINSSSNGWNYRNLLTSNNSKNSEVTIEQCKGESFIYTNKDLGMDFSENNCNFYEMQQDQLNEEYGSGSSTENSFNGVSISALPKFFGKAYPKKEVPRGNAPVKQGDIKSEAASCPWCMQIFTSLALLQRHIKSHVAVEKPKFVCQFCNTKFARSAHLKRHERTHTGEKPYVCGICQMRFARQDKLKLHLERHLQNANSSCNQNTSRTVTSYPPQNIASPNLPIKVLIPTNSNIATQNSSQNNSSTNNKPNSALRSLLPTTPNTAARSLSTPPPPSSFSESIRIEKVAKNLSPSTTITFSTSTKLNNERN